MDDEVTDSDWWDRLYEERFHDPIWTLEQLLAWVVSKDPTTVGSLSAESLEEIWYEDASGNLQDKYFLVAGALKNIAYMSDKGIAVEITAANRGAIQALQAGTLVSTWKPRGQARAEINRFHWMDHTIKRNGRGFLDVEGGDLNYGSHVRVEKDNVLRIWPEELAGRALAKADEKKAIQLLKKMMEKSPKIPTETKEPALDWVRSQGIALGTRAGDRAWERAAELAEAPAWSVGGRRSSKRNTTPK